MLLGDDGGCEGVVPNSDSLSLDLTKTFGAIHVPGGGKKRELIMFEHFLYKYAHTAMDVKCNMHIFIYICRTHMHKYTDTKASTFAGDTSRLPTCSGVRSTACPGE